VRRVRTVFHGRLTYDANWDSQSGAVRFWSYLDYIGLSGYFPLAGNDSPASLATDWSHWDTAVVHPTRDPRWNKRIVFTEVGYRSVTGAHTAPYSWGSVGLPSQAEQANDWTALFTYWSHRSYFAGVQAWQWYANPNMDPRLVPPAATDYAVQGKSAQGGCPAVMVRRRPHRLAATATSPGLGTWPMKTCRPLVGRPRTGLFPRGGTAPARSPLPGRTARVRGGSA